MSLDVGLQWLAGAPGSRPACDKVSARTTQPRGQWEKTHLWGPGSHPRAGKHLQSPAAGARLSDTAGGSPASTFIPSCLAWACPAAELCSLESRAKIESEYFLTFLEQHVLDKCSITTN